MDTRRKFIAKGSMAAAALLATNPFKAIAGNTNFLSPLTTQKHLVFIHTAGLQTSSHQSSLQFIGRIRSKTSNAVVVDAFKGNNNPVIAFDASVNDTTNVNEGGYQIVTKGGIRTGIINISTDKTGLMEKTNALAALLKNEKGCKVVVCMSQLGFSHTDKADDKKLAEQTSHIDIIIGANPVNFTKHPIVLHNKDKQEVILQSASANEAAFGKIEIGFDAQGNKNHVHILNKVPQKQGQQSAIVAA